MDYLFYSVNYDHPDSLSLPLSVTNMGVYPLKFLLQYGSIYYMDLFLQKFGIQDLMRKPQKVLGASIF